MRVLSFRSFLLEGLYYKEAKGCVGGCGVIRVVPLHYDGSKKRVVTTALNVTDISK